MIAAYSTARPGAVLDTLLQSSNKHTYTHYDKQQRYPDAMQAL